MKKQLIFESKVGYIRVYTNTEIAYKLDERYRLGIDTRITFRNKDITDILDQLDLKYTDKKVTRRKSITLTEALKRWKELPEEEKIPVERSFHLKSEIEDDEEQEEKFTDSQLRAYMNWLSTLRNPKEYWDPNKIDWKNQSIILAKEYPHLFDIWFDKEKFNYSDHLACGYLAENRIDRISDWFSEKIPFEKTVNWTRSHCIVIGVTLLEVFKSILNDIKRISTEYSQKLEELKIEDSKKSYKEKLKEFMLKKAMLIAKKLNFHDYLKPSDLQAIDSWDEEECERVWNTIVKAVLSGDFDPSAMLKPFCIKHFDPYLSISDCDKCEYGEAHGICYKEGSTIAQMMEIYPYYDKRNRISNEEYRKILSEIDPNLALNTDN